MKTKTKQTKQHKIYTQFLLPDGDKITLLLSGKKSIDEFLALNPGSILTYESYDHPNDITMLAKNSQFKKSIFSGSKNFVM